MQWGAVRRPMLLPGACLVSGSSGTIEAPTVAARAVIRLSRARPNIGVPLMRWTSARGTIEGCATLARAAPPKLHTVRYYGEYSSVVRARRRAGAEAEDESSAVATVLPSTAERRRLRRAWAQMIRRIYEADPLTCRCGAQMRILALILDPRVVTKILRHIGEKATARERAPPSSALAS